MLERWLFLKGSWLPDLYFIEAARLRKLAPLDVVLDLLIEVIIVVKTFQVGLRIALVLRQRYLLLELLLAPTSFRRSFQTQLLL